MQYKQVIIINKNLNMGKGKICSQVAHASLHAFLKSKKEIKEKWLREGAKKIVLKADEDEILRIYKQLPRNIAKALIYDKGLTQIPENSLTALGIGPEEEDKIDKYTKHLKLL